MDTPEESGILPLWTMNGAMDSFPGTSIDHFGLPLQVVWDMKKSPHSW